MQDTQMRSFLVDDPSKPLAFLERVQVPVNIPLGRRSPGAGEGAGKSVFSECSTAYGVQSTITEFPLCLINLQLQVQMQSYR